jgi:hypothetical protein
LPTLISPQLHQGHPVQPLLDARLQRIHTLQEEILRIGFQQEMLRDTANFLENCAEQLRREYTSRS